MTILASKGKRNPYRQEWETPQHIFDVINRDFGGFSVDAAASPENAKLTRYWTKELDALKQSWRGERVFANPPYSDPGAWLQKAWHEVLFGGCDLAVIMVPGVFDRQWSAYVRRGRVEMYTGRIQFVRPPELEGPESSPQGGVMLVVFEPNDIQMDPTQHLRMTFRNHKTGEYDGQRVS